jgi:hypothetical protein
MSSKKKKKLPPGLGPRVAASIVIVFAWLIYAIIHAVFLWEYFDTIQNVALIVIAFLLGVAILGAMWATWGIKISRKYTEYKEE